MCMVALGKTLQKVWMFFLWTKETCSFSSASSSASESLEKEKKKYRTLETWNNFLEAGKKREWTTPAWGEAAQCRLWKGVQWLRLPSSAPPSDGCSWVPSYSRGCFITDHLAAAPGSTAYPLQPEGDGISCHFTRIYQHGISDCSWLRKTCRNILSPGSEGLSVFKGAVGAFEEGNGGTAIVGRWSCIDLIATSV